jgi:Uma2 family endonuclease
MGEAADYPKNWLPFSEYVKGEIVADKRHEYFDGKVFATAGASENHEIVALNLAGAINQHMDGKGYRVFKGDIRLKIALPKRALMYYPDIMVTCDPEDSDQNYKESPELLIEVTSNYKANDMEKLFAHQQLPFLEQNLIIDQDPKGKEASLYQRSQAWDQEDEYPNRVTQPSSIDFTIPLKDLYSKSPSVA